MLMDKSFSIRRHEVIKEHLIADFKTRWPALFRTEEVIESFFLLEFYLLLDYIGYWNFICC